jgi:hypothetical protein
MQVYKSMQELVEDRSDGSCRNRRPLGLVVMMDDLEQVVLGILEDYVNALVFQDDFYSMYHIWMGKLSAEGHFSDG